MEPHTREEACYQKNERDEMRFKVWDDLNGSERTAQEIEAFDAIIDRPPAMDAGSRAMEQIAELKQALQKAMSVGAVRKARR